MIIAGIAAMARALDTAVIAEGIETEAELKTLRAAGISLLGYFFAKPEIETLPAIPMLLADGAGIKSEPQLQQGR